MVQRERDEDAPGLTEMVLDAEPLDESKAKAGKAFRDPPEGESELPLDGE